MEILTNAFISESGYHREFPACWEWLKCLLPSCKLYPQLCLDSESIPFSRNFLSSCTFQLLLIKLLCLLVCFSVPFSKHIQGKSQLQILIVRIKAFVQSPVHANRFLKINFFQKCSLFLSSNMDIYNQILMRNYHALNIYTNCRAKVCTSTYFHHPFNANSSFIRT